ncbi:MAG: hypothetical protein AAFW97_16920 [Pseudomonadota bacterium]
MTDVTGTWDSTVNSPMGEQKSTMTLNQEGDTVTGVNAGATGSADVQEGKVDGDTFTWKMDITVPMPMTLEGTATVEGDKMAGNIKAGAFGEMPFTATKTG